MNTDGLTTKEALEKLYQDIFEVLKKYEEEDKIENSPGWQKFYKLVSLSLNQKSPLCQFRWLTALFLIISAIFLIIGYAQLQGQRFGCLPAEACVLLLFVGINTYLMISETKLRYGEMVYLTKEILTELKGYLRAVSWTPLNYPNLHSPISPCITLQWTKRDGKVVNLPVTLLVTGDIILLRPGQKVPGKCRAVEDTKYSVILNPGDLYSPQLEGIGEGFSSPKARKPVYEASYFLLETPYASSLDTILSDSLSRPVTMFNKLGYYLFAYTVEFIILPIVIIIILIVNLIRIYYDLWIENWFEALVVIPISTSIPLLHIMMPIAWVTLTWLGTARIMKTRTMSNLIKKSCNNKNDQFGDITELQKNLISSEGRVKWQDTRALFFNLLKGTIKTPIRTANLLHVMASVTNFCCVDKKGVLSWPNPTAEKLFFLKNRGRSNLASSTNLFSSAPSLYEEDHVFEVNEKIHSTKESESVLMSLTHDNITSFGLQFDDPLWKRFLLSLKPLGLIILLNTCNPETRQHYTRFCSHITCEAMYDEDLVPVSQRRCLCELSKQMGFHGKVQKTFKLEHQLSTFRHVPPDMACKDRLARSFSSSKLKFPFPHMVSVLSRDANSGKLELMSQGTADIILDSCTDYWDGTDICALTEKDRKKILDFYHRTSLSAYCTAFAYRPTWSLINRDVSSVYLDLPPDSSHIYHSARTPTPHISTEALYGDRHHTEYEEVSDDDSTFRLQCKQIFIGMVAMQYQAKADVVQMIEQLDEACIRFIHFSKENDLRSKVFSEKMGLESGWNCHISLLSDRSRSESGNSSRAGNPTKISGLTLFRQSLEDMTSPENVKAAKCSLEVSRGLSHSAPSAINLDVAQVKFEEEVSICTDHSSAPERIMDDDEKRHSECNWPSSRNNSQECLMMDCTESGGMDGLAASFSPNSQSRTSPCSNGHFRSPSQASSSTEESASLNIFNISNKARLPKGIENIRPHLAEVDNVPLLVSLFTDCTKPSTMEMIQIMQENSEVTVIMGSVANIENATLFLKSDLALGIDPIHPQVCMKEKVFEHPIPCDGPPPLAISNKLNSITCSLTYNRDDRISLIHLILESRHFMQNFLSCFQFWCCCSLSITALLVFGSAALLPPLLSSGDVLWLSCICIPMLSISLVFPPVNPAVMDQATGKNVVVCNRELIKYIAYYYLSKFAPSVIVTLICAIFSFLTFCNEMAIETNSACSYIYLDTSNSSSSYIDWNDVHSSILVSIQKFVSLQLVIYFCIISGSFVHRMYQVWKRNPFNNKCWTGCVIIVLVLHILYVAIGMNAFNSATRSYLCVGVIIAAICWAIVLLPINEFVKRREIRVNVRYQKRARLEFGTKLGMNSPF